MFALYYPPLLELAERAGQRETRAQLIGLAAGRTLELGAGAGVNLAHYTSAVTELVITEPSPDMLGHLRREVGQGRLAPASVELVASGAEELPFPDASFDTVVGTYILCTVPEPARAVAEIERVLRPGGRYVFMEHVRASDGSVLAGFQDLVEGLHVVVGAGCHPNRRTEALIRGSGLTVERLERGRQPRAPLTVRPRILGSAVASRDLTDGGAEPSDGGGEIES